jgi:hypothetical protein
MTWDSVIFAVHICLEFTDVILRVSKWFYGQLYIMYVHIHTRVFVDVTWKGVIEVLVLETPTG